METNQIRSDRRGMLKKILGVGFAAPVITSFSMDSLMAASTPFAVTASNMSCLAPPPTVNRELIPNVGYSGTPYFMAHSSDLLMTQDYLKQQNQPLVVTSCSPAPPTRLTIGVSFELIPGKYNTSSIWHTHFTRRDVTVTSSVITVKGQKICDLTFPYGTIVTTSLQKYSDLNALLEDMAAGFALVEIAGFFMGAPFTLVGGIKHSAAPYKPILVS